MKDSTQAGSKRKSSGSVRNLALPGIVTDPLNHTTTFGYDSKDNLTTINTQAANEDNVLGRGRHELHL